MAAEGESNSSGGAVAAGLAGAAVAAPVAGTIVSGLFGNYQTRKRNEAERSLAEYQNAWNLEQWNRENAYNAPTAQMARLKAAGLNPNLVYGSGAANQAASSPRAASVDVQTPPTPDFGAAFGRAAENYFAYRQLQLQQAQADARIDLMRSQAAAVQQDALNKSLDEVNKRLKNTVMKSTLPYQVGAVQEKYNRLVKGNVLLGQQAKLNDQQLEIRWKQLSLAERRQALQEYIGKLQFENLQLQRDRLSLSEKEYISRVRQNDARINQAERYLNMNETDWEQIQNLGGSYFKAFLKAFGTVATPFIP